ncbi:uncharacterized protein N7459_009668 [Penicillium hispanicum]|uniref:uncharacterized protein n=1 Tax=Penicillium hispanicum TaxID=1080232 RepID=UPI00254109CE|nr:uncharacterized protein N7459_009668 [Penicillium hispanicum]KAJ5570238.1 hypothetical protein N7459_009668 [Penicillium hispanicum]
MTPNYVVVDVFTNTRFLGNPLAIVLVPAKHRNTLTQTTKQKIAIEFNLSETIFVHEPSGNSPEVVESLAIDTFTPNCEIPFAGHPTIGTVVYILRNYAHSSVNLKGLVTKAGPIPTSIESNLVATGAAPIVSLVKGLSFVLAELADIDSLASISTGLLEECVSVGVPDDGWNCGLTGIKYFVDLRADDSGCKQLQTRMFISWEDLGTEILLRGDSILVSDGRISV